MLAPYEDGMKNVVILVACSLAIAIAPAGGAQVAPPSEASTVAVRAVERGGVKLIGWRSGPILCAGSSLVPRALPSPSDYYGWIGDENVQPNSVILDFDVDSSGRPHAIKRRAPGFFPYGDSLDAALATASFAPGAERSGCSVTYDRDVVTIDAAPIDRLIAYMLSPAASRLPQTAYDRVRLAVSADSTCGDPLPAVLRRNYPDFKAIPQAPGTRGWSMIGFDIDRRGRPVNVRVARSTGNAALDRASARAVGESRFAPGARRGCVYPYWRNGPKIAAPPIPDALAEAPNETCPAGAQWMTKPVARFPEAYRRLAVEGWGVVRYDVAPWGQTGNLRVVASEPSAAFGNAALEAVRSALREPSARGHANCTARVRFVLAPEGEPSPDPGTAAPPPF